MRCSRNPIEAGLVFESRDPAKKAWLEWKRESSHRRIVIEGVGPLERWVELSDVQHNLVSFRMTFAFEDVGTVLTSDSTLRFRERDEIVESLQRAAMTRVRLHGAPVALRLANCSHLTMASLTATSPGATSSMIELPGQRTTRLYTAGGTPPNRLPAVVSRLRPPDAERHDQCQSAQQRLRQLHAGLVSWTPGLRSVRL